MHRLDFIFLLECKHSGEICLKKLNQELDACSRSTFTAWNSVYLVI